MIKRCRLVRRRKDVVRAEIENLEGRFLLAVLGLDRAVVKPDGRMIELSFSGPAADGTAVPEHAQGWFEGLRLTSTANTALEPLGTVVQVDGDTLVWTVTFLIGDAKQTITFDAAPMALTAPERLIQDQSGNWTGGFSDFVVENNSLVDSDGFSTENFQRGDGGVTIYVSNSQGKDSRTFAQAQDPRTPIKTLAKAFAYLKANDQDGRGAAVQLLRGDTFLSKTVTLGIGGQDRRHPLVIEDYWFDYGNGSVDPKTRPVVQTDCSGGSLKGFQVSRSGASANDGIDHVVIRRIKFQAVKRTSPTTYAIGLFVVSGGENWLFDDIVVTNYSTNLSIEGYQAPFDEVTMLRSVVIDAHLGEPPPDGTFGASNGLFVRGTTNLLVSQSTFDRNGRTTKDFTGRNMYSHNIYLSDNENGPATVWGNFIRAGSNYGVQMRAGGILAYNYLGRNSIAAYSANAGGFMTHNVVEAAEDISSSLKTGLGLHFSTREETTYASVIEQNIIVHAVSTAADSLLVWPVDKGPLMLGVIRNNSSVNGGGITYELRDAHSGPFHIDVSNNLIDARKRPIINEFDDGYLAEAGWDWLESSENLYTSSGLAGAFRLHTYDPSTELWDTLHTDFDDWRSETGTDSDSILMTPKYVNGSAKIGTYWASLGGNGSESSYVGKLRSRGLDAWSSAYDMLRLHEFYASQYRPTNLPSLGDGPYDYYGGIDYRPAAPDLMSNKDTGSSDTDNVTRSNSNLQFEAWNTVTGATIQLWRDGVKVATGVGDAKKSVILIDPATLPDGVYRYEVRLVGTSGMVIKGLPTFVTIDRTPPSTPAAPVMVDVVGLVPTLMVAAEAETDVVELWRRLAGTSTYVKVESRVGSGVIVDTSVPAAGEYEYVTRLVDAAGNASGYSGKLKLTLA